jgi:hypothetical protein
MIGKFQERIVNEITRGGLERRVMSRRELAQPKKMRG